MLVGKIVIGNSRLNFWDLGGQKELQSLWEKYFLECHAIVFVVDSTDSQRIQEVKDTFRKLKLLFCNFLNPGNPTDRLWFGPPDY